MNIKQEAKLKMIMDLMESGYMNLPSKPSEVESIVRSVISGGGLNEKKNKSTGKNKTLSVESFLFKSISTITGKLKSGECEYLSKIKDSMARLNYFNNSVTNGVLGTYDFDETFDIVINSMVSDGIIELSFNKIKLK